MPGQSQSAFSQFAIGSTKICFQKIFDDTVYTRVDDSQDTMCGSLDHDSRMVTPGITVVRFRIIMRPSPQELSVILPYIGFNVAGANYTLVTNFAASKFTAVIDRVAKVSTYTQCMISKAIFTGARGFRGMQLELHVVGQDVTHAAPGTFSATALTSRSASYPLNRGTITLEGQTRLFNRYALMVNNFPNVEWNNSQTATAIESSNRLISLSISSPYTSGEIDLLDNPVASGSGAVAQLAFARGSDQTTFNFAKLIMPPTPPSIPLRSEIRLAQTYLAYIDGTNQPLAIVHQAA